VHVRRQARHHHILFELGDGSHFRHQGRPASHAGRHLHGLPQRPYPEAGVYSHLCHRFAGRIAASADDVDMANTSSITIVYHGAIVLLIGLLAGLAALTDAPGVAMPWRAVHSALLTAGVWLIATAAVYPSLVLDARSAAALRRSLVATAYAFLITLVVQAVTGVRGLEPGESVPGAIAFAGNIVTVLGGLLAALLTLQGAHGALKTRRAAGC
jgi:hypothetical protein